MWIPLRYTLIGYKKIDASRNCFASCEGTAPGGEETTMVRDTRPLVKLFTSAASDACAAFLLSPSRDQVPGENGMPFARIDTHVTEIAGSYPCRLP